MGVLQYASRFHASMAFAHHDQRRHELVFNTRMSNQAISWLCPTATADHRSNLHTRSDGASSPRSLAPRALATVTVMLQLSLLPIIAPCDVITLVECIHVCTIHIRKGRLGTAQEPQKCIYGSVRGIDGKHATESRRVSIESCSP